jgi:hypothetical protein
MKLITQVEIDCEHAQGLVDAVAEFMRENPAESVLMLWVDKNDGALRIRYSGARGWCDLLGQLRIAEHKLMRDITDA